jgi:hypothetical protein
MLYIIEIPLHFAIVVSICIITLGILLLSVLSVNRASVEQRMTRLFGFLFVLFIFLMYIVFAISLVILPANANVIELLPIYQIIWGFAGLHGFCLIFYCLGTRYLREHKWVLILILLGGAVYVVLLLILPNPITAFAVTDGWLNYVAMPFVLVFYAAILGFIYMFLVPLFVAYRITKRTEGLEKRWIWIGWFGLFLSFLAAILISAVQFTVPFMLYSFGLVAIAWILIGVGAVSMGLLSKTTT